jgi:hypothetical protein
MMNRLLILLVVLALLLLAGSAVAMTSPLYRLDWFTPLTTGGGGAASSAHYAVRLSLGQTAVQSSASVHYQAGLGYWAGIVSYRLYLPILLK